MMSVSDSLCCCQYPDIPEPACGPGGPGWSYRASVSAGEGGPDPTARGAAESERKDGQPPRSTRKEQGDP